MIRVKSSILGTKVDFTTEQYEVVDSVHRIGESMFKVPVSAIPELCVDRIDFVYFNEDQVEYVDDEEDESPIVDIYDELSQLARKSKLVISFNPKGSVNIFCGFTDRQLTVTCKDNLLKYIEARSNFLEVHEAMGDWE